MDPETLIHYYPRLYHMAELGSWSSIHRHELLSTSALLDLFDVEEPMRSKILTERRPTSEILRHNSRAFFWLDEPHHETLLGANAYRDNAHDVFHIDTAALLEHHADRVTLPPINSGSTIYNARPRGSGTFLPIADYPFEEPRRKRGQNAIVELAVDHGIGDITEVLVRVERRRAGHKIEEVLWER
jgi:hypothetical protein